VNGHFEIKAWVCVSDKVFGVTRVTGEIINSATRVSFNFNNLDQAQQKLIEVVKDKRFLIVVDDVWTERYNDWNQLQLPFHGGNGSRVIVTIRHQNITRMSPYNEKSYVMHDLAQDLSQWASRDIFCCVMESRDLHENLTSIRRLTLCTSAINQHLLINQTLVPRIFRCIRTIRIASEKFERLLECISDLKHLRYLDLEFKKIKLLPKIPKLCNLQMLFLSGCCALRDVQNIDF
ncbi:putative disease resistance RPP13-like protein 1, partial [Bienertia sinuspersici]